MSYSNSGGGTLTLPSPTHVHHVDVGSAVRSLRRSLSRSPSKFNLTRTASSGSDDSAVSGGPCPESPCPPPSQSYFTAAPPSFASSTTPQQQTPFATPFRSSVKLSLRSARPKAAAKPVMRPRPSPKSPLKRALSITSDSGNSTPTSSSGSDQLDGQENSTFHSLALAFNSPSQLASLDKPSRHSMHLDLSGASRMASASRLADDRDLLASSTLSPLKRSDATMDSDGSNLGSPVAKRRSLHGISTWGSDLNIFDQAAAAAAAAAPTSHPAFDIHDDATREYQLAASLSPAQRELAPPPPNPGALPKRSSSLRKSTLQQRHDPRSSWGRRQGEKFLAQQSSDPAATPIGRNRPPRASLDQILRPDPRESPFTSRGPLLNPSAHALDRVPHQPHPLSRSLTTSSSSSSLPDDSPTHIPVQNPDRPRYAPIFGRSSLPIGAQRPKEAVATPDYKSAKPLQSAFASTGLVSKMTRYPELDPSQRSGKPLVMPDTPCKKQVYPSNTYPPSSGSGGRKQSRFSVPVPQTPFVKSLSQQDRPIGTFGASDKMGGLFKPRPATHVRKASLLSCDGDSLDYLGVGDSDLPPTPTKSVLAKNLSAGTHLHATTPVATRHFPPPTSAIGLGISRRGSDQSSSPLSRVGAVSETPKTPQESMAPPDPSRLSISTSQEKAGFAKQNVYPPATPTAGRAELATGVQNRRHSVTPVRGATTEVDDALVRRFGKVDSIGAGEFSVVFRVSTKRPSSSSPAFGATPSYRATTSLSMGGGGRVYAVKKLQPFQGQRDRALKLREVVALEAVRGRENVLQIVDHWEHLAHLYIQTEYCDGGSLDSYLERVGERGRLDDFRIWKILLETSQGIQAIHDAGFIHLDLKPANILITYEGYLKIGDFGMATPWPAPRGIEAEGDRHYIAPEILRGKYDKPADVFALGLIVLEIAINIFLPDGGDTWVELREGRLSKFPSLTKPESEALARDVSGIPLSRPTSPNGSSSSHDETSSISNSRKVHEAISLFGTSTYHARNLFGSGKRSELARPPAFMVDPQQPSSLDNVIAWMIRPDPGMRPTIEQVLNTESIRWVRTRRQSSATIFEGNWGPADLGTRPIKTLDSEQDTEMTDV